MRAIAALLILALGAEPVPGYEAFSKRELWETILKCDGKAEGRRIDLDACTSKLATRTSTVINTLVLPPPEDDGVRLSPMTIAIGAGALLLIGGLVGWVVHNRGSQVIAIDTSR